MTRPLLIIAVVLCAACAGCGEEIKTASSTHDGELSELRERVSRLETRVDYHAESIGNIAKSLDILVDGLIAQKVRWTLGGEIGFFVKQLFTQPNSTESEVRE